MFLFYPYSKTLRTFESKDQILTISYQSNLEFMLRFQQYIELVRTQDQAKLLESIAHAKKYLLPFRESYPKEVQQACGLLAFPPGTRAEAYAVSPTSYPSQYNFSVSNSYIK